MAQTKTTIKLLGKDIPVTEVPIRSRKEVPAEFELEDGSVIRVAAPVTTVYRIENEWDLEGNPLYFVKNGIAVNVVQAGDEVRKK